MALLALAHQFRLSPVLHKVLKMFLIMDKESYSSC